MSKKYTAKPQDNLKDCPKCGRGYFERNPRSGVWQCLYLDCGYVEQRVCPNCGLTGEAAKWPHSCRRPTQAKAGELRHGEAGKFDTKTIREMLECDYKAKGRLEGFEANYWQHLHRACDKIDRLEFRNEELSNELRRIKEFNYEGQATE